MGCKDVGCVCCVMHVKEPRTLIVKEKGLARVFLDSRLEHPAGWIQYVRAANLLYYYYFALAQHEKKDLVFLSAGYTSSQATSRSLRSRVSFAESLLSLRVAPSAVILL